MFKRSRLSGLFRFRGYIYYENTMVMRKIHISEEQFNCLRKKLDEINLNGDEALNAANGNASQAARTVIQGAKDDGVSTDNSATSVSFSNDALKQNGVYETSITKKTIKEAKIANLKKNSIRFSKRDIN